MIQLQPLQHFAAGAWRIGILAAFCLIASSFPFTALAQQKKKPGKKAKVAKVTRPSQPGPPVLKHVSTLKTAELNGAVNLAISPDGQYLYCPAWRTSSINILKRDAATGAIERYGVLFDSAKLSGVVHFRLSPGGELAVATAFQAKSVCLFSRDADNGALVLLAAHTPADGAEMQWPIDSVFSPDARYVYTVDDRAGAMFVFQVVDGKALKLVERFEGRDGCLAGSRGIAMHPDGKTAYATGMRAGTLCVLARDAASGRLSVRQVLKDGEGGINALAGAMCIECSPDGQFVYTTSGRFMGDQAVCAWKVEPDGKLSLLQEFVNGAGELRDFTGGGDLALSPDGRNLYASGTTSCSLACFRRDSASGSLQYETTVRSEATGLGTKLGSSGPVCSPDGRYFYLALEDAGAISVFQRAAP